MMNVTTAPVCKCCENQVEHMEAVERAQDAVRITRVRAANASEADAPYAQRQFELAVQALKRITSTSL